MFKIKNKIIPSKNASYNCDGCLGIISIVGNTTLHETSVIFPTNSPLIKFAMRPKNIPIGETHAMTSNKIKADIFLFIENKYVPIIIPIKEP